MEDLLLDLELFMQCDMEVCPPPIFDLPPPPRPPWLEDLDDCSTVGVCPNDPIVNTLHDVNGLFHSVITIVAAAVAIVVSLIIMAVFLLRQRRRSVGRLGYLSDKTSSQIQPCGGSSFHSVKRLNHYSNNLVVEHANKLPTLIIGGVPFQVVRRESAYASTASGSTLASPPVYETIDDAAVAVGAGDERIYAQLENLCDNCECETSSPSPELWEQSVSSRSEARPQSMMSNLSSPRRISQDPGRLSGRSLKHSGRIIMSP